MRVKPRIAEVNCDLTNEISAGFLGNRRWKANGQFPSKVMSLWAQPTLGKRNSIMWGLSIFELFDRGGPVMWPILACSILGSAIVIDRTAALIWANLNYDRFISRLDGMIASGKLSEAQDRFRMSHKPLECVVAKYLQSFSTPRDLREKAVATEASRQLHRLERRLNWLAIVTHLSPLLGLLGTVAGLVSAFHEIDLGGGNARPGDLASGIWSALLTTVFGLSVALPCLAAYHLLEHRVGRFALEMEWTSAFLDESLLHATSSDEQVKARPQSDDTGTTDQAASAPKT